MFETEYREREDGTIESRYKFRGEELATKSDVYEWYLRGNAYTDTCDTRSKVAIGFSIVSMIISLIFSFICMVS
ncbi:MAG: hypothetical protein NC517_09985 [Firmicutes bacterium]|nr:hypothetical protein [Bacillota bacterium]